MLLWWLDGYIDEIKRRDPHMRIASSRGSVAIIDEHDRSPEIDDYNDVS